MAETAQTATDIHGNGLYHERARRALPLLVRQAEAGEPIEYGSLASELGMPNARNLNFPLGSIGTTLEQLAKRWRQPIPPLQCLVVNKHTGLPGEGIGWFIVKAEDFRRLPLSRRRDIVRAELAKVFAYPRWREVLEALKLPPPPAAVSDTLLKAAGGRRGGESEAHRRLKHFVLTHPEALELTAGLPGEAEQPLASGDCLDVSFPGGSEWIGVEVKSRISDEADILRGIFQCVKYRAVMEAMQIAAGRARSVRVMLVLEGDLPPSLRAAQHALNIDVVERISPPATFNGPSRSS